MRMNLKAPIAALLCAASILPAAPAPDGWEAVLGIRKKAEIRVETADKKLSGAMLRSSEDSISLVTRTGELSIPRTEVKRVFTRGGSHRARNAIIGAAVGVAVGVTMNATLGELLRNESSSDPAAALITIPTVVGTAVGAAMPSGGMKKIYDSKR